MCTDTIISVEIPKIEKLTATSTASPNITTHKDTALSTTMLVVIGVLVACALVGGGFIAVQVVKKLRKRTELLERNEASPLLLHRQVTRCAYSSGSRSDDRTGYVYETVEYAGSL
jgi:uncharacterized protein HemX